MKVKHIVVVGASAGGVTALMNFVKGFPADFEGSIFVVLHIPPYSESRLPEILSRAGALEAVHARDGDPIESGKIYVAVSDQHLILEEGKVRVKKGPKENRSRPSIDALFRSAAVAYGSRVIGVILSGVLDDGVPGLWAIKEQGGCAIIQKPEDAEQPQLPQNALEQVVPDFLLAAADMAPVISGMVKKPAASQNKLSADELKKLKMEVVIATKDDAFEMGVMEMGQLTPFVCPQCHGALVKLVEGHLIRFRCHTGHAYTASSLLAEVSEAVESQLWQCMRGLEEMDMLFKNIADQYDRLKRPDAAKLFRQKSDESGKRARIIHDEVFRQNQYSEDLRLNKNKS